MADGTHIEWTDATWPVVQGCDYEGPGCTHCYAVPLLWRMAHHPDPKISAQLQGVVAKSEKGKLHFTGKVALREDRLDWPLKWRSPRHIFVPSHGDLFHQAVPDEFIDRVFAVMALAPQHAFQVLTKRSRRMREYCSAPDRPAAVWRAAADIVDTTTARLRVIDQDGDPVLYALGAQGAVWGGEQPWPLRNVWLGVSVEDQQRADERIPDLLATPAAKRFLSCEPMLASIDLSTWIGIHHHPDNEPEHPAVQAIVRAARERLGPTINWIIVGGESGPNARPMHPAWARALRDQCQGSGVAFFFKQFGEWISADEWLDRIQAGPAQIIVSADRALPWRPTRPLNFKDAEELARVTGRAGQCEHHSDGTTLIRVGKKAAGRLLDGHEWSEFPA